MQKPSGSICRRNTQALFVKHIHGWAFRQTHWRILAAESALGLTLVLWAWNDAVAVISRQRRLGAPPMPPDQLALVNWEPVFAGGIALAGLALIVLTLRRTNSRFVAEHSAILP